MPAQFQFVVFCCFCCFFCCFCAQTALICIRSSSSSSALFLGHPPTHPALASHGFILSFFLPFFLSFLLLGGAGVHHSLHTPHVPRENCGHACGVQHVRTFPPVLWATSVDVLRAVSKLDKKTPTTTITTCRRMVGTCMPPSPSLEPLPQRELSSHKGCDRFSAIAVFPERTVRVRVREMSIANTERTRCFRKKRKKRRKKELAKSSF